MKIQRALIDKLGFEGRVDAWVSSAEVPKGRPYPYMTQELMRRANVLVAAKVAKTGDTSRDIEEGLNAGCGLSFGVLTGAGGEEGLKAAGAHMVLKDVVEFCNLRVSGA